MPPRITQQRPPGPPPETENSQAPALSPSPSPTAQTQTSNVRPAGVRPPAGLGRGVAPISAIGLISDIDEGWDEGIKVLVYGKSGTGKTTFWATFPGPVLAMICSGGLKQAGELRSINTPEMRTKVKKAVIPSSAAFRELIDYAGQGHFNTVVLDHASGFADMILKEVLGVEELPAQKSWGMATQQAYGQMTGACKDLFRRMLNLPCNVVIVAQERNFNDDAEGDSLIRPTVGAALSPSLTGWLNPACDYVVQTFLRPRMEPFVTKLAGKETTTYRKGKGVEFCLLTGPHEVYMTKFRVPGGVKQDIIVDPSYEKMMAVIRGG